MLYNKSILKHESKNIFFIIPNTALWYEGETWRKKINIIFIIFQIGQGGEGGSDLGNALGNFEVFPQGSGRTFCNGDCQWKRQKCQPK